MEILAPCGSPEHVQAAVFAGADAVYLGVRSFSARQNASNFTAPELREAVRFCHGFGVSVYVAVNILVRDAEGAELQAVLETLADAGPDALIVQDLGAARYIRKHAPHVPLHASTQMSVHTLEGVRFCAEQGFSRVVIARECDKHTLAAIAKDAPCGIEAFVHGALCVSVSGQCLLSAVIGGRSGNRGLCAQPCRMDFTGGTRHYALSLKDLSLVSEIGELSRMGVTSLKIEGRMKRPEYVAASVRACRDALEGRQPDMESLRAVFSRQGFTKGYYENRHTDMQGTRTAEDARDSAAVLPQLAALYRTPLRRVPVDLRFTLNAGEPSALNLSDGTDEVTAVGPVPEPARTSEMTEAGAARLLTRMGDTPFALRRLDARIEPGLTLSAASVNALRRDACESLLETRIRRREAGVAARFTAPERPGVPPPAPLRYRIHCTLLEQAEAALKDSDCEAALPVEEALRDTRGLPADRLLLELPGFTQDEPALIRKLSRLWERGFRQLLCQNPAHARIGRALGFTRHGGFRLQIHNSQTAASWGEYGLCDLTVSPELSFKDIHALRSPVPLGIVVHGQLPLMLLRRCPFEMSCKRGGECPGFLTDRTSRSFPVVCHGDHRELLNADTLWLADRLENYPEGFFLALLLRDETPEEVHTLLRAYREGAPPPAGHTRGLYYRGGAR